MAKSQRIVAMHKYSFSVRKIFRLKSPTRSGVCIGCVLIFCSIVVCIIDISGMSSLCDGMYMWMRSGARGLLEITMIYKYKPRLILMGLRLSWHYLRKLLICTSW